MKSKIHENQIRKIKIMSKKIYTLVAGLLLTASVWAQAPEKMSYQAVIRNSSNTLIVSTPVGMKISVLQGTSTGTAVYVETHTATTNANGLVSVEMGNGTVVSGAFNTINWANGPYFIKTETDPTGGTNYTIAGTSQFMSVPYALYAENSGTPGPQGPAGDAGVNGAEGASAYQIAVINGYGGTETQWLVSLQGATGPAGTNGTNGGFTHYLGEEFGGGVVFHLWRDASGVEHGLIIDKINLSAAQVWSNIDQTLIGASAQSSWNGLSNSNAIVGQAGHTSSAAALCLNSTNGGQSDWYLPSIDELSLLWHSRFNVNKSLSAIGGATVLPISANSNYWSSTENDFDTAWIFDFYYGFANAANNLKNTTYYVRAVRAF
jgi:hypothetical protein